jgi:hypothetical protein
VSIIRIGLAETKNFSQGYDAIFGQKKATPAVKSNAPVAKAKAKAPVAKAKAKAKVTAKKKSGKK